MSRDGKKNINNIEHQWRGIDISNKFGINNMKTRKNETKKKLQAASKLVRILLVAYISAQFINLLTRTFQFYL